MTLTVNNKFSNTASAENLQQINQNNTNLVTKHTYEKKEHTQKEILSDTVTISF